MLFDAKDIFEKFYSNIIALSVLGVGTTCNYNERSKVYSLACDINKNLKSLSCSLKIIILNHFSSIANFLPVRIFESSIYEFFQDHVIDEIKRREREKIENRQDFLQHVLNARKESGKSINNWNDGELIIAQVMSFFTAGFSTTSTLFQACCFALAKSAKIQNEIFMCNENDSNLFIEQFLHEVLRKWSPIFMTSRICNKNCTVKCKSGEIYNFDEGDLIEFPLRLLNNDHFLIDDPQFFNPQRDDNPRISFGFKPRDCVGKNFAMLIVKTLLIKLVKNFSFLPCKQTSPCEVKFYENLPISEEVIINLKRR